MLREWEQAGRALLLDRGGVAHIRRGFELERIPATPPAATSAEQIAMKSRSRASSIGDDSISQLIVTTKFTETVGALSKIKHRLNSQSAVLFLQQGPGIIKEVNDQVFPDPETRPNYMLGFLTHVVYSRLPRPTVHLHGMGHTYLTTVPRDMSRPEEEQRQHPYKSSVRSVRYLFRRLHTSPLVMPVAFAYHEFLVLQLERLAVRAVIGPLTAIFDCFNGELLYNGRIDRVMRLMLSEISLVIRSLPEMQNVYNLEARFDPDRLETIVASVAQKTSSRSSSMRLHVNDGLILQIESTTGYIIRRGEELGIRCVMNFMIMQMVLGKALMVQQRNEREIPFR